MPIQSIKHLKQLFNYSLKISLNTLKMGTSLFVLYTSLRHKKSVKQLS